MATKRKITVERKATEEKPPQEMSWRDWLLRRYARYWYWVGFLFLDIIILFEPPRSWGVDPLVAVGLAALALAIEVLVYMKIWGKKGPLRSPEHEDDNQ